MHSQPSVQGAEVQGIEQFEKLADSALPAAVGHLDGIARSNVAAQNLKKRHFGLARQRVRDRCRLHEHEARRTTRRRVRVPGGCGAEGMPQRSVVRFGVDAKGR